MNLYILRHASAGTRRENPLLDVKRPLDKEGKQQCILVGSYLNALRVQFDLIASSPLRPTDSCGSDGTQMVMSSAR